MPHLPTRFAAVILVFAPLFVHRSWRHARVLLVGAILTPGRRTVASVLRTAGRSRERHFVNYRERQMKRFKSAGQAQRFLSAHDPINNLFHLRGDHVTAAQHRADRAQAFATWAEVTNAKAAA